MAIPKNSYATYDAIGNREDLADAIYNISPTDTPVLSSIDRVRATGIKHEWQVDNLAAATSGGAVEGDDFLASARVQTQRLDNQCQIWRKDISVSRTQRVVQSAGRRDEYAYQLAKAGKELKRNIEKTLLAQQGKITGGTTTARLSGGLINYLQTDSVAQNHSLTATYAGNGETINVAGPQGGTAGVLKALLDTVIGVLWDNGSDANVLVCGKQAKQAISNLSNLATLYREVPKGMQGAIIGGADLYVSDFGEFVVVPDRFMPPEGTINIIYVLDYEYLALAELDPIDVIPIAKTGDADKAILVAEGCLEVRSYEAHGAVVGYTLSPG